MIKDSYTLEEQKANRKIWIEALRSGKYKQGRHSLRSSENKFCCLGVLCDVMGVEAKGPIINSYSYDGERGNLSPKIMNTVGLASPLGDMRDKSPLSLLNDKGIPFAEIASIIESEPRGLFLE